MKNFLSYKIIPRNITVGFQHYLLRFFKNLVARKETSHLTSDVLWHGQHTECRNQKEPPMSF